MEQVKYQIATPEKVTTISILRDFILDRGITSNDTILLCTYDFDDLILDHRKQYGESLVVPYFILGVLIKEDDLKTRLTMGQAIVVKDDVASRRAIQAQHYDTTQEPLYSGETIYRCGWCGNVVDYDGAEFAAGERQRRIAILETFGKIVNTKRVNGKCCPNMF